MNKNEIVGCHAFFRRLGLLVTLFPLVCFGQVDGHLADSLKEALKEQGWQESVADDGSVIFHQVKDSDVSASQQVSAETIPVQSLDEMLQQRNWQATWKPDGSLLLIPRVPLDEQPVSSPGNPPATDQSSSDVAPDMAGFEYWRIERGMDGSMLFHPLSEGERTNTKETVGSPMGACDGQQFFSENVLLPVDEWSEVNVLAQLWIEASGSEGIQVGRIRKLFRVYIVSLVSDQAPFSLVHQLAIRSSDGGVIFLE